MPIISLLVALFCTLSSYAAITFNSHPIDTTKQEVIIHFDIPEKDFIYKDYLTITSDNPAVTVSQIQANQASTSVYSPSFKKAKDAHNKSFNIACIVETTNADLSSAHLVVDYYQESNKKIMQQVLPITFSQQKDVVPLAPTIEVAGEPSTLLCTQKTLDEPTLCDRLSNVLTNAESVWIQIALALLLGLLLSLTPCIYPMIPITIGILQAHGSTSVWRNFSLACAYTCGIATTFALLGLVSAFTGSLFGSLMNSPIIILCIVAVLAYLAGAMIGWYPMYTPSFMQGSNNTQSGGSLFAAFTFGAASGTVASPCLSPGLILLLSIVTKLGSVMLGFALLFAFGVGLSIPLLIIGTFSSSLHVLPRAGMWMVEIKKLFGFMMFGMCLYFLQAIVPCFVFMWLTTALAAAIGYIYLKESSQKQGVWYLFYSIIGMSLIAASVWYGFNAYQLTTQRNNKDTFWLYDYNDAHAQAQKEHKKVLVDVTTPCCTICKAIDKKFFANQNVQSIINQHYVPVKINGADNAHEAHMNLQKHYAIIGAPTLLIIDSVTGKEIKRWGTELYDYSIDEYINELKSII